MLTIDLTEDQVEAVAIAETISIKRPMPQSDVQQKLEQAKAHLLQAAYSVDRATAIVQNEAMPCIRQAMSILVEISKKQGWQELGYRSMRQLIQGEFEAQLNLSSSQIYRLLGSAEVRQDILPIDENADSIPNSHLEELGKLPSSDMRRDAWREICSTAPQGKITTKHIKAVVSRRQNQQADESVDYSLAQTDDPSRALEGLGQPEDNEDAETHLQPNSVPTPHLKSHQIVIIRHNDRFCPQQCKYSGCWGVVYHVLEASILVALNGEIVEYLFEDIESITTPPPNLKEVCDRVTNLWQIPNLPVAVQDFLKTYYQRRLDFAQENLDALKVIESLCHLCQSWLDREYQPIAMQSDVERSGAYNQISRIISATE